MDLVKTIESLYKACEGGSYRRPTIAAAYAFVVEEVGEAQTMLRRMGVYGTYAENNPREANVQKFVNELADVVLMTAASAYVVNGDLMDATVRKLFYLYYKWGQRPARFDVVLSTGLEDTFTLEVGLLLQRMLSDGIGGEGLDPDAMSTGASPLEVACKMAVSIKTNYPEYWKFVNTTEVLGKEVRKGCLSNRL